MSHSETEVLKIIFRIANNSDKKFFLIVPYIYLMVYTLLQRMLYCWCGQNVNIPFILCLWDKEQMKSHCLKCFWCDGKHCCNSCSEEQAAHFSTIKTILVVSGSFELGLLY